MKNILIPFISLFITSLLSAQSVDLNLTPENVTLNVPDNTSLDLAIVPENFSHQLFLSVDYTDLPESVELSFSESSLTSPYEGGKLNIEVQGGTPDGEYEIYIKAYNGPVWDVDTCYVTIKSSLCGWKTVPYPEEDFSNNSFKKIAKDKEGNFWITCSYGLIKYNPEIGFEDSVSTSLLGTQVNEIVIDSAGNKWLIGWDKSLIKYNDGIVESYTTTNSPLPSEYINQMMVDKTGLLWVATSNGIATFDGMFWSLFNSSNSALEGNYIASVCEDSHGNIFVICDLGSNIAVFKFDGINWTKVDISSNCNNYYSNTKILADEQDNIWLASWEGILKIGSANAELWEGGTPGNQGQYANMTSNCGYISGSPGPIEFNIMTDLSLGKDGEVWFTGFGLPNVGQILKYDGEMHAYSSSNSSLPLCTFDGVAIDNEGNPWVIGNIDFGNGEFKGELFNLNCQEDVITSLPKIYSTNEVLKLFPNPSSDIINFDASKLNYETRVFITDIMGNKFEVEYELSGQKDGRIHIESLNPGIYIMTIESDGKSASNRFCKQ